MKHCTLYEFYLILPIEATDKQLYRRQVSQTEIKARDFETMICNIAEVGTQGSTILRTKIEHSITNYVIR